MEGHVKIVAIIYIVLGAFGLMAGLAILVIFGGIAGIVHSAVPDHPDAGVAVPIVALVGAAIFFFVLIISIPNLIAGVGLLQVREWARILAIVLSILHLFAFPLGTALGIYALWALLNQQTISLFTRAAASPPHG